MLFALFKMVGLFEEHMLLPRMDKKNVPNKTVVQGLGNIARIVLSALLLIVLFMFFSGSGHLDLTTILAGSGLGLAVAAQPIIANYFGGLILYVEGNFKVGDWVHFTEKNIEGFIESIGPRSSAIRTFDRRLLYVPNAWFSSESIVNASRMTHRRIWHKIVLGWVTKLEVLDKIVQDIRIMVNNHPGIDKTQLLMVHFTGFAQHGLEITIYAFTKTRNLHTARNVQENILREAKGIIEAYGGSPPAMISYRFPNPEEASDSNWPDTPLA